MMADKDKAPTSKVSGASINTGTGGFDLNIDGQVKTYDFDVGESSDKPLDPVTPDHGDIHVDNTKKDISKQTKTTLAKYLKSITKDNAFPIDSGLVELPITDGEGLPHPLSDDPINKAQFYKGKRSDMPGIAGEVFTVPTKLAPTGPGGLPTGWPKGADGKNLALTDPVGELTGKLTRGKEKADTKKPLDPKTDGNHLLPAVKKDSLPEPLAAYTTSVLGNNRFTSANQLIDSNLLDSNTTRSGFNPKYTIRGKSYTANQLAQVGPMLSLRGSQEFPAAFNDKVNPTDAGSVAGALLPSPNQLGVLKINNVLLEARDALEHLDGGELNPGAEIEISPLGNQSWGALNNVEEPFNGLLNLGMVAMALAMQVALTLAFEGLGLLISLLGGAGAKPPAAGTKKNHSHIKGHYYAPPGPPPLLPSITDLLGIRGTIFPFGDALSTGTVAFFLGADQAQAGLGSQLLSAVTSALSSAFSDSSTTGFVIIISRLIIRSGQAIAAGISDIGKAFASNPISGIKAIIGLLTIIKESKLIAAINTFTTIGDAIMSEPKDSMADPATGYPLDADGVEKGQSHIENFPNEVPHASVIKSRLQGSLKLAWSSNRVPTSYLLPDSIASLQLVDAKLGSFKGVLGSKDPYNKGYTAIQKADDRTTNGARIPRDGASPTDISVKSIEAALESEYMPFYFHDLRTNEIIGFQAFLASLTDDYAAAWESPEGYGRVDPVKIYKSTTRKISMSFFVAALDEKDFDDMWIKLNKLVTLVYPQYTKGRLLTDGNNSFVQPFSQLIGASPLIRIRLGDLLRSNYSRFTLARLFGAADGDMMLDGAPIVFEGAADVVKDLTSKAFVAKILQACIDDKSSVYTVKKAGFPSGPIPTPGGFPLPLPSGPSTPDQAPTFNVSHGDLRYFKLTQTAVTTDNKQMTVKVDQYAAADLTTLYGMNAEDAAAKFAHITQVYSNTNDIKRKVLGGANGYVIPVEQVHADTPTLTKVIQKLSSGLSKSVTNIDTLSTFLDIEKNALVKSFRSIQGKGLAGVIESMNFDWYDKVTWEIHPHSRAPKMCKVTLNFSPIHDISPGIDHMGYNRAPIYPVGHGMGEGFDPDTSG